MEGACDIKLDSDEYVEANNSITMSNVTGTTSTVLRDCGWGRRRITGQSKGLPAMGICDTTIV